MLAARLVLGFALVTAAIAFAPSAHASDPCVLGSHDGCAVGVKIVVCVTEPCDPPTVCVGFGLFCARVG